VKNAKVIVAATIALMFAAPVMADGIVPPTKYHVPGESLDNGLGELSKSYTGREYVKTHVAGEKLDNGLGMLSPTYTGVEYQNPNAWVIGQPVAGKKDSGLGEMTKADATIVVALNSSSK
jgi:hypothetical protein